MKETERLYAEALASLKRSLGANTAVTVAELIHLAIEQSRQPKEHSTDSDPSP